MMCQSPRNSIKVSLATKLNVLHHFDDGEHTVDITTV